VTHTFDYSQHSRQALDVSGEWLDETHPGDGDVMFDTTTDGSAIRNTTPESLALWEQHIPEFVASLNDSSPLAGPARRRCVVDARPTRRTAGLPKRTDPEPET
jgi:hypothetical protein